MNNFSEGDQTKVEWSVTYKVYTSVANPEMPITVMSLTLKTLWKLVSTVIS